MQKENTNLECHQPRTGIPKKDVLKSYPSTAHVSIPADFCRFGALTWDLVEWHRKLVMKNIAMKDFTLGVLP